MGRMSFILLASGCSGAAFGFLVLGKWRTLFHLVGGDGLAGQLIGIVWRVVLYQIGLFGIPAGLFISLGLFPLRALEVIVCYLAALLCSIAGERAYAQRSKRVARSAGFLTEEDF